jgi:prenylated cyclic peptide (anacyclamide/piricyclamide family)
MNFVTLYEERKKLMKKKNLQPKQTAPVERDNTAKNLSSTNSAAWVLASASLLPWDPFAGDDAE